MKKIIVISLVAGVLVWISLSVALFTLFNEVEKHGFKTVVERIWCGKEGCK